MKLKKIVSLLLIGMMLVSCTTFWAAASYTSNADTVDEVGYFINIANDCMSGGAEGSAAMLTADREFLSLYNEAINSNYVTLDNAGCYVLDSRIQALADSTESYDELLHMFDIANDSIQRGLCYVDPVTYQLTNYHLTREIIKKAIDIDCNSESNEMIEPYSSSNHGCKYSDLYLGGIVSTNYETVSDYWDQMIKLSINNPNLYPKTATIGFWVGKIQEGGAWDYKVQPGYSPYSKTFCCTYGEDYSKQWKHLTSEFIGNYNYGYTGELLFSLSILKKGSDAAAGNFFNPDTGDYPAITEGYNDASDIE